MLIEELKNKEPIHHMYSLHIYRNENLPTLAAQLFEPTTPPLFDDSANPPPALFTHSPSCSNTPIPSSPLSEVPKNTIPYLSLYQTLPSPPASQPFLSLPLTPPHGHLPNNHPPRSYTSQDTGNDKELSLRLGVFIIRKFTRYVYGLRFEGCRGGRFMRQAQLSSNFSLSFPMKTSLSPLRQRPPPCPKQSINF